MVVQLMKYGADPSLIGEGCSCIHLAAQFGHTLNCCLSHSKRTGKKNHNGVDFNQTCHGLNT